MGDVLYYTEIDDIVIEITPAYVQSELWDFPSKVPIKDIKKVEVKRFLHRLSTLSVPSLLLLVGVLLAFVFWTSNAPIISIFIPATLICISIYAFFIFIIQRENYLIIESHQNKEGVLYFSPNNKDFRRFVLALEQAIGDSNPSILESNSTKT